MAKTKVNLMSEQMLCVKITTVVTDNIYFKFSAVDADPIF